MRPSTSRRTILRAATLGGAGAIAGCLGSAAPQSSDDTPTDGETPTASPTEAPASRQEWLHRTNVPTGQVRDARFEDEVEVLVGSQPVPYSFRPAALKVSPGTTVTWIWSDPVDAYNVVAVDGSFDSGEPTAASDATFSATFAETGSVRYVSEPHADYGMRGLIEVEEPPRSGYPKVDRWLAGANGYDGTIVDATGGGEATVRVGAPSESGHFAFDPPALKVDAGTTVVWEWTGNGGPHHVAFQDGDVQSEMLADEGARFTHTFTNAGVYRYACEPHEALGQKGAIVVV